MIEVIKYIVKIADSKKGEDIKILDLRGLTSITDYFIIISATSVPHLQALAREISFKLKKEKNLLPLFPYNENDDRWILMDYGDFIIHIFIPEAREYYNLENLWYEAKEVL